MSTQTIDGWGEGAGAEAVVLEVVSARLKRKLSLPVGSLVVNVGANIFMMNNALNFWTLSRTDCVTTVSYFHTYPRSTI